MSMIKCEDEKDSHFDGSGDHSYGQEFPITEMWLIKTPWSSFRVCNSCKRRLDSSGFVTSAERLREVQL